MEERYKSLAAMNAEPWIEHFKKTAGHTSILSTRPRPVVIKKQRNGDKGSSSGKDNDSLPLTIVSPIGQSNEMAEADLRMESDKRANVSSGRSVSGPVTSLTQRAVKRKLTKPKPANDRKKKKITKLKDIFSKQ